MNQCQGIKKYLKTKLLEQILKRSILQVILVDFERGGGRRMMRYRLDLFFVSHQTIVITQITAVRCYETCSEIF